MARNSQNKPVLGILPDLSVSHALKIHVHHVCHHLQQSDMAQTLWEQGALCLVKTCLPLLAARSVQPRGNCMSVMCCCSGMVVLTTRF